MNDAYRQAQMDRLARLRETMSDSDVERLKAQFDADPNSLSEVELDFLFLVTREKIIGFEEKARRRSEKGGGSEEPSSND